jgi:hypothetical protein
MSEEYYIKAEPLTGIGRDTLQTPITLHFSTKEGEWYHIEITKKDLQHLVVCGMQLLINRTGNW